MEQWFSTIAKTLARYARAYPLRQIALAAALFLPWTICLHLMLVATATESVAIDLVGTWGTKVTAAGLAFLTASAWLGIGNVRAARARRRKRSDAKIAVNQKQSKERERWRAVIRGLSADDQKLLCKFVDDRRIQFEGTELAERGNDGPLQRLNSLGIFEMWWPYARLSDAVFELLIAEPELVGSAMEPTTRI